MSFNTVEEALAACELAGYQPRSHVTGLGEQTYWVHLPDCERGSCFWGDIQFLGWANHYWRLLEIEKLRDEAGWEELQEEDSPAGLHGWHAPCGTHEDAWRELGRPMPEEVEIEKIRHQAGWWKEYDEAGVLFFWYAPCGTREDAWQALGRPMPEDAESTVAVAAGRTEGVCQFSTVPARVESGTPAAYRLIRRGDGNGNTLPVLQGLFTWTEGAGRGAEWRDLETQDEPHVEDAIPFGPINH